MAEPERNERHESASAANESDDKQKILQAFDDFIIIPIVFAFAQKFEHK